MSHFEADSKSWRWMQELPSDTENLAKAWALLEIYSRIPSPKVEAHIRAVRDKAWAVFPYACIGRWRFLDLYLTSTPEYPEIVSRVKAGSTFLDAGCCFGHILRQLALDGAPPNRLAGTDLRGAFWELGYELFRDRDSFQAGFVAGDMLDPADAALPALDGTADIVHAASLFHLFGWDDQIRLGERVVRFFKANSKDALLVGRQVGSAEAADYPADAELGLGRYHHSPESLRRLWDEIGERTGTHWKVDSELINLIPDMTVEKRIGIRFVIRRLG